MNQQNLTFAGFAFAAFIFAACGDDPKTSGGSVEDQEIIAISDKTISGVSQKGPFVNGSSVTVQELDGETLAQTGDSYEGKIKNDLGEFSVKVTKLASQYALLKANGFYRNEVTGEKSKSQVTLYALTDLSDRDEVNVNLLTHLAYERSLYLATSKDSLSVSEAKKQAEAEVLKTFGIEGDFAAAEDLNIFGENDQSAALLAVSVLMQGNLSEGDFSERLANYAADIESDGIWNDSKTATKIADWANSQGLGSGLLKIRENITKWELSADVPSFEKYVNNFWWQNYGLGTCDKKRESEVLKNQNTTSANADEYYICKSSSWQVASDLEKDTYKWATGKDAEVKYGDVVKENCYVFEDKTWRAGNKLDCTLELQGCTKLRQDTVGKGSDNVWHICDAKSWRNATTYEKDTFGWKDSADGAIKKGNVTDTIYVFDKTKWRVTSNVEAKLGGCVAAIADSVGKVESIYYICKSGKWVDASALEYDTYKWTAGKDGDCKLGSVNTKNCYVYEDSSWRSGNLNDCSLGLRGCTALRQDTVGKGSDKVWHICDAKSWRNATTYEKDTFGWKDSTDGTIKKGNVTDGIYVFDKTKWRLTNNVEAKLGGCVSAIADSVGKVGTTYYICKSNKWIEASAIEYDTYRWAAGKDGDSKVGCVNADNCYVFENKTWRSGNASDCSLGLRGCTALRQDTVGKGSDNVWHICDAKSWRNASTYEKDTFGWDVGIDGEIKKGNVTDTIYVFDKTAWRVTSNVEAKLGGCVSAIADSVGKVGSTYYICKSNKWSEASPIEYDTYKWNAGFDGEIRAGQINTKAYYIYDCSKYNWREASTIEKDTYDYINNRAWLAGIDGEIKKGSVTDSIYLYDATAWRTADDIESVLGGCVAAIVDSVGKAGSSYYICTPREWKNATELQYDTYKRNCTEYGQVIYGNVNDGNAYFCYGNEWRHFYGDETKAYGKLVDNRDGKIYRTIEIGNQTWMAENLNYADEDNFPSMKDKNWCYKDEPDSCEKYGRLYTWSAAIDSIYLSSQGEICGYGEKFCNASNEKQGICPEQWHLPSLEEWEEMFDYVGGISVASKILRSKSAWLSDKNGTDDYGFSVVPSGTNDVTGGVNKDPNKRYFTSMKHSAFFWTSSDVDKSDYDTRNRTVTYGVLFYFDYEYAYVSDSYNKAAGRSVRCIKD